MSQVKTHYIAFLPMVFMAGFCLFATYMSSLAHLDTYDISKPVAKAEVQDMTISVPSWNLFTAGKLWSLVSPSRQLSLDFTPELITTVVKNTVGADKVATSMEKPLESMFEVAGSAGIQLMLSSAYRSANDQESIYNSLLTLHGSEYVQQYVAAPGASEHQTGLAVDLATVTHGCEIEADACSLEADAILWLREHAAEYGFIERYPSGKQSITGVAGEHWHYRYVGVPLAKALTNASMTLDEFVQQIAPGYSR